MVLKYIYAVFIGVLVVLFIGIGIAAFYPGPKPPISDTPTAPVSKELTASEAARIQEDNTKNQAEWKAYQTKSEDYNKNVSIITLIFALIILAISLTFAKSILVIADGLLLGGLFTLIYSLFRSFNSSDYKFMFIVISIGLLISVSLGYIKFIKSTNNR